MDCSKWGETGLLFASGELDDAQTTQFKEHLAVCESCASEFSQYSFEKKQYFTFDILADLPSARTDANICALCAKPFIPTGIGLFSMSWVKRAALSAFIFALGLGAGGYFTFAYFQARSAGEYARTSGGAAISGQTASSATSGRDSDSAKHGASPASVQAKQVTPGAGAPSQGIVTVDLKKE